MIRRAGITDMPVAAELTQAAWFEMYERAGALTSGNAEYITGAKSIEGIWTLDEYADSIILVSTHEGDIDGVAIASTFGIGGKARLISLAVRPDRRGLGVGRRLLGRMEEMLAAKGMRELELNALARLKDVVRFYERNGYVRDTRRQVDEAIPTATVQLSREIGTGRRARVP